MTTGNGSAPPLEKTRAWWGAGRRLRGLGVLGLLAGATLLASGEQAATAQLSVPGSQVITNAVSNLCMGVKGKDAHAAGAVVEMSYCNPGGSDRGYDNLWKFSKATDDYVTIKNGVSGLCLGVRGVDSHTPGTGVEVYTCNPDGGDPGLDNQWRVVPEPDGFKRVENRVSGLCLGVRGVDAHNVGAEVEVYNCTPGSGDAGRDNRWRFQGL